MRPLFAPKVARKTAAHSPRFRPNRICEASLQKEMSWLNPNFVPYMTVWS